MAICKPRILGPVVAAGLLPAAAGMAAEEPAPETIVLNNGQTIEGQVVRADRNTVQIRRARGGLGAVRAVDIQAVFFPPREPGGEPILGSFMGWEDGVYRLSLNFQPTKVKDGVILETLAVAAAPSPLKPAGPEVRPAAAPDTVRPAIKPSRPAAEPAPAAVARVEPQLAAPSRPASEPPPAPAVAAVAPPVAETPPPVSPPADGAGLIEIDAAAAPARPGDRAVTFRFNLSRPADKPLVLIYSTIDGTARAGADYEAQRGILNIPAGKQTVELTAPILARGQTGAGGKTFSLFISTDPKSARTLQRRVQAVIPGHG